MTDSRDEHEPYGFTESPVIAKLQDEIARLTAERDEARRQRDEVRRRNVHLLSQLQEYEARND